MPLANPLPRCQSKWDWRYPAPSAQKIALRGFENDTEWLEKLFYLYTEMTSNLKGYK